MFVRQVQRASPPNWTTEPCRTTVDASGDPQPPSTWSWGQIHDWISANERPITTDGQDLFGRAPVATRIAEALREGRSVALLGAFGTGKSSILNLVLAKLRQCSTRTTRTIVARLDVWAVPRPVDAPRVALDQVIDALDHHVDTLGLRGLPITYQRLVAALPVRNISRVLGLQTQGDSLAELQRLAPVLEVLNARLVLIVEDVERTTREFDTRHLQRCLWALRGIRHVSFVLACDPDNGPSIDFSKLCDVIELLRPMEYEHVGSILVIGSSEDMIDMEFPRSLDLVAPDAAMPLFATIPAAGYITWALVWPSGPSVSPQFNRCHSKGRTTTCSLPTSL